MKTFARAKFGTVKVIVRTTPRSGWKRVKAYQDEAGRIFADCDGVFRPLDEFEDSTHSMLEDRFFFRSEDGVRLPDSVMERPCAFGAGPDDHRGDDDVIFFKGWTLRLPRVGEGPGVSRTLGDDVLRLWAEDCPEEDIRAMIKTRFEEDREIEALLNGECVWHFKS